MAVNESGNYTNPSLRAQIVEQVRASSIGGKPGQWTLRKSQIVAKKYKEAGGGYKGTKKPPQTSLITGSKALQKSSGGGLSTVDKAAKGIAPKGGVKELSKKVQYTKPESGKKPVEAKDEKSKAYSL